ncbi:hypothetical protein ACIA5C_46860 [Actinoplanes sp. NPDC051343]|uniref:PIN-like domain-containing protein n=1 Tax=Actinoplanes sp. NPDC051343 TaxID=3363906 RepID=UPI00378C0C8E
MTRSTRSSASQPEFFADRCPGRGASRLLHEQGWIVHDITDHFANDAQDVSDPDWMSFGLNAGWALLTHDKRIRTQVEALQLLAEDDGQIFCLSSGDLRVAARADRFASGRTSPAPAAPTTNRSTRPYAGHPPLHRAAIHRHIARGRAGLSSFTSGRSSSAGPCYRCQVRADVVRLVPVLSTVTVRVR